MWNVWAKFALEGMFPYWSIVTYWWIALNMYYVHNDLIHYNKWMSPCMMKGECINDIYNMKGVDVNTGNLLKASLNGTCRVYQYVKLCQVVQMYDFFVMVIGRKSAYCLGVNISILGYCQQSMEAVVLILLSQVFEGIVIYLCLWWERWLQYVRGLPLHIRFLCLTNITPSNWFMNSKDT